MALNINTSIVDFAKSKNIDSSFEGRKRLYERIGLNKDLGDYRGSEQQNVQFLKTLQSRPELLSQSTTIPVIPTQEVIKGLPKTQDQLQSEAQAAAAIPQQFKNLIPPAQPLTPEEILAKVRQGADVQFAEAGAEQSKNVLASQTQGEKTRLENTLASRGLYFSGRRETGLQALDAEQVAKQFNIDLGLAKIVSKALQDEQTTQLKEATTQQKAVEGYLKTQGLQLNPLTGEVEFIPQTSTEKRAEATSARAEAQLKLSEERFATSEQRAQDTALRAEAAAARANRSLALSEARFVSEEQRREMAIADDTQSVVDGLIGLADVPSDRRGVVIQRLQGFLKTPSSSVNTIGQKLDIATNTGIPVTLGDEEIRAQVFDSLQKGENLQDITRAINTLPITNKDRALNIANEIYAPKPSSTGAVLPQTTQKPTSTGYNLKLPQIDFSKLSIPSFFRY